MVGAFETGPMGQSAGSVGGAGAGLHTGLSNYLLADRHVKALYGVSVFGGDTDTSSTNWAGARTSHAQRAQECAAVLSNPGHDSAALARTR